MSSFRIGFCSADFWPISNPRSWWNRDFCQAMVGRPHQIQLFTTRWSGANPAEFDWRGHSVIRSHEGNWAPFGVSIGPPFSLLAMTRSFRRMIEPRRYELDLLLIHERPRRALAALQTANRLELPAILRIDASWQELEQMPRLRKQLEQVLQTCLPRLHVQSDSENWLNLDIPEWKIAKFASGVLSDNRAPTDSSAQLRQALANTHPIFELTEQTPLAIMMGRLTRNSNIPRLIAAWSHVVQRMPDAKLWISGEGSGEDEVWQSIVHHELNQNVILIGQFDATEDLVNVADLIILSTVGSQHEPNEPRIGLAALAAGKSVFTSQYFHPEIQLPVGNRYAADWDASRLGESIGKALRQIEIQKTEWRKLSSQVEADYNFQQTVRQFERLMMELLKKPANEH